MIITSISLLVSLLFILVGGLYTPKSEVKSPIIYSDEKDDIDITISKYKLESLKAALMKQPLTFAVDVDNNNEAEEYRGEISNATNWFAFPNVNLKINKNGNKLVVEYSAFNEPLYDNESMVQSIIKELGLTRPELSTRDKVRLIGNYFYENIEFGENERSMTVPKMSTILYDKKGTCADQSVVAADILMKVGVPACGYSYTDPNNGRFHEVTKLFSKEENRWVYTDISYHTKNGIPYSSDYSTWTPYEWDTGEHTNKFLSSNYNLTKLQEKALKRAVIKNKK